MNKNTLKNNNNVIRNSLNKYSEQKKNSIINKPYENYFLQFINDKENFEISKLENNFEKIQNFKIDTVYESCVSNSFSNNTEKNNFETNIDKGTKNSNYYNNRKNYIQNFDKSNYDYKDINFNLETENTKKILKNKISKNEIKNKILEYEFDFWKFKEIKIDIKLKKV